MVTLLAGGMLWLLGLGAVITIVYFLKRQARRAPVSSLMFWRGLERQPQSALRLRWTQLLGLFLQLLALGALVTGLAQPVWTTSAGGVRTLALVLDGSASMRAHWGPEGTPRYLRATREALKALRSNPAAEATLIGAQERSSVLVPPTHDHGRFERALANFEPTYQGNADIDELVSLIQSQFPDGADRVIYITDHQPSVDLQGLGWDVRVIGSEMSPVNVALTRFVVREQPSGDGVALFLEAWNGDDVPREFTLQISSDERLLAARAVGIPAETSVQFTFTVSGPPAPRYLARLLTGEGRDDWPEDDVRYATLPAKQPWRVLWVGEGDFYLKRFLLAGQATLSQHSSWDASLLLSTVNDVVVLTGGAEVSEPGPGRYLLLGTSLRPWVEVDGDVDTATARVRVEADHPLLEGLDPADWRLLRVPRTHVAPQGRVILSINGVPLLYLYEVGEVRLAFLGVDLGASNLGLSVDFPILMHRLLSWLSPQAEAETVLTTGTELPMANAQSPVQVIGPDGRSCQVGSDEACGLVDRPGFYELVRGPRTVRYAANLPAEESRQLREEADAISANASSSATTPPPHPQTAEALRVARPLWPYLVGLGVALLAVELVLFDRSFFSARARPRAATRTRGWDP